MMTAERERERRGRERRQVRPEVNPTASGSGGERKAERRERRGGTEAVDRDSALQLSFEMFAICRVKYMKMT